jgi:hypothetical protein
MQLLFEFHVFWLEITFASALRYGIGKIFEFNVDGLSSN